MKTIGLLGGMSWESTLEYYRLLNEGIRQRLGGLHSARCLLYSVDFADIEAMQVSARWDDAGRALADCARSLERGGAQGIVLCTNTMHRVADAIQNAVGIPLLHIADATAHAIQRAGVRRVALLGTRFTMEQDFYRGRLEGAFGLDVLTPDAGEREVIHRVIYDELCLGIVRDDSRAAHRRIIAGLVERGAQGVILGCTELMLLVKSDDSAVPLFDTTALHVQAAVDWALLED